MENTQPKISVISVALNDRAGLARTIDSVRGQTYRDFEHIIIDGASTDGTLDMLDQLDDHRVRAFSEPDKGIYDAMNKGLGWVTGDVFQFLNAGDVYEDETVLYDVAQAFKGPGVRVVYGSNSYFDNTGHVVRYWPAGRFARWKLFLGWVPNHSTVFADSKLIGQCGFFDKSFKNAGDYEMFLRWFLKANIVPHYLARDVTRMEIGGFSTSSYGNAWLGLQEVRRAWKQNELNYGILAPYAKAVQKLPQKIFGRLRSLRKREVCK